MHANNEVGTIQPISDISRTTRESGILFHLFHTDAAQSIGKISTRVEELGVDLLSIAGHKCYGPKGVGALHVREGVRLEPLIHGAGHESGRRAGTENVLLDVGLGAACALAEDWVGMESVRQADKDKVLREAFRVLKPAGRFAVSGVVTRAEMLPEIRQSVLLWVGCVAGALEENEYRSKLVAAGFDKVEVEPKRVYRAEDARESSRTKVST